MTPEEKTDQLFDFAANRREGFTYVDVQEEFGWHRNDFLKVVRALRMMFKSDTITLTCEPQGSHQPWLYKLVGTYDDARLWSANRIGDLESRLETVHAVAETLTKSTDGRSPEGRKVRKIERTIGRLIEDLADIASDTAAA